MTDKINPEYYKTYSHETIDMMVKIYGLEDTAMYCEMTAFKYRMRMGKKQDNSIDIELGKEDWYLAKAQALRSIIKSQQKPKHLYDTNQG